MSSTACSVSASSGGEESSATTTRPKCRARLYFSQAVCLTRLSTRLSAVYCPASLSVSDSQAAPTMATSSTFVTVAVVVFATLVVIAASRRVLRLRLRLRRLLIVVRLPLATAPSLLPRPVGRLGLWLRLRLGRRRLLVVVPAAAALGSIVRVEPSRLISSKTDFVSCTSSCLQWASVRHSPE